MRKEILGSLYFEASEKFGMGYMPQISKTIKAEKNDLGVVEMKAKRIGNLYGEHYGTGFSGNVWDREQLSPTITTMQGGNREPMIVAMRGRNPDNPSNRTTGIKTEQRLEPNSQGICNTLTSVQKDNLVMECQYGIRKLTPFECWRLMEFADEDFLAAKLGNKQSAKETLKKYPHLGKRAFTEIQRIERMSNSQLYKQAGNSIVKPVLMAILGQMIPGKENMYKDL